MEEFQREDLAFCAHLGDLIDRQWGSFAEISRPLAASRHRWYQLLGNHDFEVLDDEKDESMREFAHDLIRKSAKQASARLQFARIAFGAAGSAGSSIDLGDAEQVARGFIQDDSVSLVWQAPREYLPKNIVKLLLNLLMVATHAIPRGGEISVSLEKNGERAVIRIGTGH